MFTPKKIFILLGHPDSVDSINARFVNAYEQGARSAGHEVRRMNIGDLKFDPILHKGYRVRQNLEPDLLVVQENIKWCKHLVIFYPTWWSSMPALLKGLFDRMWLPGFAYKFHPGTLPGWERLLKGRSARVVVTSNTSPFILRVMYGDTSKILSRAILWFAGISPVRVTKIGNAEKLPEDKRVKWDKKMVEMGKGGR
ncbi:MAG: hypothetical protein RLZZ347_143 [Candidatus Parcubacteria bacterium]|jgi:putative NADPH-quinone reductase